MCLLFCLALGLASPLAAQDEGKDNLDAVAGITRPTFEWPLTLVTDTAWAAGRETLIFPFRLLGLGFYPNTYFRDYGTGDFWGKRTLHPTVLPWVHELPAMPRKLKDSEQPHLLDDSLYPDAKK
jgi:hypothetical protein